MTTSTQQQGYDLIPSTRLRFDQRERKVPVTMGEENLLGGGFTIELEKVLQQWWHIQHKPHNHLTGLNGEWRYV